MRRATTALGLFALGLTAVAGCEMPSPGTGETSHAPSDLTLEGLGDGVGGELAGEAFTTEDAYFRAFDHAGHQRVDLVFAEVAQDDCGLPVVREGRRVFVRFDGVTELPAGEVVVERDDDGDVSVHYERKIDERWVGVGRGVARISLDEISDSLVEGRLNVCFDDGADSCVSGAFSARICLSRLDGYLPREGTGTPTPPTAEEAAR